MISSGNCGGTSLCYLGLAGCIRTEQARAGACLQPALVPRMIEAILPLRYTDNARFFDGLKTPITGRAWVSNNPCQQSMSARLLCRRFFDTSHSASAFGLHESQSEPGLPP
jgi:hypothetical protein